MSTAIIIRKHGGPEVLELENIDVGRPGAGEIRLRQTAVGINFHDIYVRSGQYRTLDLPGVPGIEAAGVVEETGPGVAGLKAGDRIAYITNRYGCYAGERLLPAELALRLPGGISDELAASIMLKGLTVEMLAQRVHRVEPGQWVLVHAAAGGVGRLLCQWAAHRGANVIGTVSSEAKAAVAREAGCAHVVFYRREDFVARVNDITGGRGVDVAYDSVGRDTFSGSIDCLAVLGHVVSFGQSSGPLAPLEVPRLMARSNKLSRPSIFHYAGPRAELESMSAALFAALSEGWLKAPAWQAMPLADAAEAHRLLEAGRNSAPLLLVP